MLWPIARVRFVRFTDSEGYFVSEDSVYRLLKAHDLIASPAFIVMKPTTISRTRRIRNSLAHISSESVQAVNQNFSSLMIAAAKLITMLCVHELQAVGLLTLNFSAFAQGP